MADRRRARLTELLGQARENQKQIKAIFDKCDTEGRDESPTEKESIKSLNLANEPILKEVEELKAVIAIKDGLGSLDGEMGDMSHSAGSQPAQGGYKSLGQTVTDSKEMTEYIKSLGHTPLRSMKDGPKLDVQSFLRTLITGASGSQVQTSTSGGALVRPDFKPIVDSFYQKPLTVRNLITAGETGSDVVEYVRVTGITNNAAPVAEAANTTDGDSSGRKPESAMTFEAILENVRTIAHWVPVTNRALQDAAQLRTFVDEMLRYGIEEEIESQILYGSGSGENFTGVFQTPNINTQDFDTDILRTTRKARTLIQVNGHTAPTAYVLNPYDWESIDLTQDSQGRYYFGGPTAPGQKTLWGLPVIESELLEQGVGLIANWKFAYLWDRMQSTISVSNSHNDFFVRNLNAILGEFRGAFGIVRPQAFARIDLVTGITS